MQITIDNEPYYIAKAKSQKDAGFYYAIMPMLFGKFRIEKTDGCCVVDSW